MNPLSSIRLPVSPQMMQGAGMKMTPDLAPAVIPQYELGKIAMPAIQPGMAAQRVEILKARSDDLLPK